MSEVLKAETPKTSESEPKKEILEPFYVPKSVLDQVKERRRTVKVFITKNGYSLAPGSRMKYVDGENYRDYIDCEIVEATHYKNFKEMLEAEGFKKVMPHAEDLGRAEEMLNKIFGYENGVKKYGCFAIKFQVLK